MSRLAVLGTGLLGSGMVRHFLGQGALVTVWNRTEAKARALEFRGATVAVTATDAVAGAQHIHLVLPDDAVVDALLEEISPALPSGAIVVDHSTTLPAATKARFERARALGIRFLHAPVFMSPQMASEGRGLMLVSGPQTVMEEVRSELEGMASEVWHVGERPDLAAAYKLFGNAMLLSITAGLADVMSMARANEIDPMDALTVFSKFQPCAAIHARGPRMARGDFAASFTMTMARKDAGLMMAAAEGEPLVVLRAIASRMDDVIASGRGELDLGALGAGK